MAPDTRDLDAKLPDGGSHPPEDEGGAGANGTPASADRAREPAPIPASADRPVDGSAEAIDIDVEMDAGSDPAVALESGAAELEPGSEPEAEGDLEAGIDVDFEERPTGAVDDVEFENKPTAAVDAAVEVVDIDDLGDDEVYEIEEIDADDVIDSGTGAPPPTPGPPPPPTAPPPTPGPPPPPAAREPDDSPAEAADPGAAPVAPEPEPPLETQLEMPTVLEHAINDIRSEGYWEAQAERLVRQVEAAGDRRSVAAVAYELGELYERRLADEARAVKAYGRALQSDPSLRANLWAIRRVFYRRGLWPNLLKLIDAEVRFAADDAERADLLTEKGNVLEDRVGDPAGAREAYEKAIALDAGALAALTSLERLAVADGDNATLERIWRQLADASSTPSRRLAYLLDLAELHLEGGDFDAAAELAREAAALEVDAPRVARLRERVGELTGDGAEIIAALELRVAHLLEQCGPSGPPETSGPRRPGQPLDRSMALRLEMAAMRRRQARVARELLGDGDRAWNFLESALTLAPGEPLILADLSDLAEQLGKPELYDQLAQLVQGSESLESDPARSMALSLRRAEALMRGGQGDQARALLDSLSAQAPGFLPIAALREREALGAQDWRALAQVLTAAADASRLGTTFGPDGDPDPAGAAALYVQAGDLLAAYVGDPDEARTRYGQALESLPGYPPALEALTSLHEASGRFDEATALLELHSETGSPEQRRQILERLVRIYDLIEQPEQSLAALQRLVPIDPDSAVLRWRIHDALAALGRHREQAEILAELAGRTEDPSRRATDLLLAGRLWERAGEPGRAAELYRGVLEAWPQSRYARAALLEGLRTAGRWDQVVAERIREADELPDGAGLVSALREAAEILAERLGKPAEAADLYRRLLDRVPGDPFVLRALADTLLRAGDAEGAVAALEQCGELQTTPEARASTLLAVGAAQERVGRTADAADSYRRAAEAGPEASTFAGAALLHLGAASGDPAQVADAAAALASGREHAAARSELYEEAGWTTALALGDLDRGYEYLQAAADADPSRPSPRLGAALIQARRGDVAEVGDALARLAGSVDDPRAAAALLLRAAAIAEAGGDDDLGRERRDRARMAAPDDVDALVAAADHVPALSSVAAGGDDPRAAFATRAALLERRAAAASDPQTRDDWQLDRAEALEGAGQLAAAGAIVAEILARRADDIRALALLRRLGLRGGDRGTQARAALAMARLIGDPAGRLALLREAAALFSGELDDRAAAVAVYRRILGIDPGAPEFDALRAIYVEADDLRGLVELLSDRLAWLDERGDEAARVPHYLERAALRERIGDGRGASRDLAALLAIEPAHPEALWRRAGLLSSAGEASEAAAHLRRFLDAESDPERRARAELLLAEILAENMNDLTGALGQLERVVEQSPDDLELRERLIALASRAGDWSRAVREIREVERRRPSATERARDELRAAAILRDKLGEAGKAREALERARQLDPLDLDAVRELAEMVGVEDAGLRRKVLRHGASDVRAALVAKPERARLYERLAVIAGWLADDDTRYFALSALGALGALSAEQKAFVDRRSAGGLPAGSISTDDWDARLVPDRAGGFAEVVWRTIAETVARGLDIDPGSLGFSRGDRVAAKNLARSLPAVARVFEAFGVGEYELYVAESRPGQARVLSHEKPVVLLGADVARADTPAARFLLGRAAAQARHRTGTLADLRDDEILILFAAAARTAGVSQAPVAVAEVFSSQASAVEERARQLTRNLGRRERKALVQLAGRFAELGDPPTWRRAALATSTRAGLLLSGDLNAALEILDVGRGGRSLVDDRAVLDLLAWSVSDHHIALRRALGAGKSA